METLLCHTGCAYDLLHRRFAIGWDSCSQIGYERNLFGYFPVRPFLAFRVGDHLFSELLVATTVFILDGVREDLLTALGVNFKLAVTPSVDAAVDHLTEFRVAA